MYLFCLHLFVLLLLDLYASVVPATAVAGSIMFSIMFSD